MCEHIPLLISLFILLFVCLLPTHTYQHYQQQQFEFENSHEHTTEDSMKKYTKSVGHKFGPQGNVIDFAGNTIICHLPQQGEGYAVFDAILDIYRAVPKLDFKNKFSLLPPSSYHMTIFEGLCDRVRGTSRWAEDIPRDINIEECNTILGDRLKNISLDCKIPIYMKINLEKTIAYTKPITLYLEPLNDEEANKLREVRFKLATTLKIPYDEGYQFHLTLAYLIEHLTPEETESFSWVFKKWCEKLAAHSVIAFGLPEYCTFRDMFAFHTQFYIK